MSSATSELSAEQRVVLDTNILVSAAISQRSHPWIIFEMLLANEIKNYTTMMIIDEMLDVFSRQDIIDLTNNRQAVLEKYLAKSSVISPRERITACSDPDDNKFLECAVQANADAIITGDRALLVMKRFRGILILDAKGFLHRHPRMRQ